VRGKLFIPDRTFCVGVGDGSLPSCGKGQDLTAGDAKPPGEQRGGRMEVEHVGESGFGPWGSTSGSDAGLVWEDAGGTGSVRPGGPCWCKSRWFHHACGVNQHQPCIVARPARRA